MPIDKALLLEQINMAITRNLYKRTDNVITLPVADTAKGNAGCTGEDTYYSAGTMASIGKMQRQLNDLEEQNDQLVQLVNFLVENLPALVMNIVKAEEEKLPALPANEKAAACGCLHNMVYPTRREMEVLELLVKGFCAKEIANRLFISESTVITHKKNLREKFNAKNTVELISKAHVHFQHQ